MSVPAQDRCSSSAGPVVRQRSTSIVPSQCQSSPRACFMPRQYQRSTGVGRLQHRRSTGRVPVEYLCTRAAPVWRQRSVSAQYRCSRSAALVQCRGTTKGIPLQYRCLTIGMPAQCWRGTSLTPAQCLCSAKVAPSECQHGWRLRSCGAHSGANFGRPSRRTSRRFRAIPLSTAPLWGQLSSPPDRFQGTSYLQHRRPEGPEGGSSAGARKGAAAGAQKAKAKAWPRTAHEMARDVDDHNDDVGNCS